MKTDKVIYKYPVTITDRFKLELPVGAEVLSVQSQHGQPMMWVLHDREPDTAVESKAFRVLGTGHQIVTYNEDYNLRYLGTAICSGDSLVWHVFEEV